MDFFEGAPCGLLSLTPDSRIANVNRTICDWTGFPRAELIGRSFRELLNAPGRMFYETHFAPLLRMQGFFDEVALDLLTASGATLATLANAREKRDADGGLLFIRISIFKAVARRRRERELVTLREEERAARSHAEEAGRLREQFVAVLGHDLRNPLAAINAGANLLLRRSSDDQAQSVLRLMKGSVARMSGLIDNVLDFARGRLGGGLALNREPKAIDGIIQQIVEEGRRIFEGRQIDVRIAMTAPVDVDHGRVGQLLSNLLGNALTHGDAAHPVTVAAMVGGGAFRLSVANAGPAIPEAAMARLFHPFYRGEVKPQAEGLGLGLYIASEIALAHGGRMEVESNGAETVFAFVLPLEATSGEQATTSL